MTEAELTTEVKTGTVGGMYLFYGDEDYLKNYRMLEVKKAVLGDTEDAFNSFSFVFGEGECDLGALSDALMAPPMMAERKFISVFFAALDSLKENNQQHQKTALLDFLRPYADDSDNVVVISANSAGFDAGTTKAPSGFLKNAQSFMKCVEFPYQTDAKLYKWMERHIGSYGLTVEARILSAMVGMTGRSMYTLSGELAKVAAHAASHGKTAVDEEDIKACVIRTDQDDDFALSNAIANGDTAGALSYLQLKMRRREDPILILGQVSKAFADLCVARAFLDDGRDATDFANTMKLNPYRASIVYRNAQRMKTDDLAHAMELCREADRQLKMSFGGYAPLERLISLATGRRGA